MKWHFLKIACLFLLVLGLGTVHLFAETSSTTHNIKLEVSASIVLYVDESDQVFGLFHIAGSRELMDLSRVAAFKDGINIPLTNELMVQYSDIAESGEVNWGTTGYYPVRTAGHRAAPSDAQDNPIKIITVIQDV